MHFRIQGLPTEPFAPLFAMSGWALAKRGAVRRIAERGAAIPAASASPTPKQAMN